MFPAPEGRCRPGVGPLSPKLSPADLPACHAGPDRLKEARCPQFCLPKERAGRASHVA